MARKILALAVCIMISLMTLPSAHAGILPVVIHCSASGSGLFYTDFDMIPPTWEDIVATGACAAESPGKSFTVTLTGSGQAVPLFIGGGAVVSGTVIFNLNARLTDLQNGRSKTYPQRWIRVAVKWIIQSRATLTPAGVGSVKFGPRVDPDTRQKLNFAWTFLAFQTP